MIKEPQYPAPFRPEYYSDNWVILKDNSLAFLIQANEGTEFISDPNHEMYLEINNYFSRNYRVYPSKKLFIKDKKCEIAIDKEFSKSFSKDSLDKIVEKYSHKIEIISKPNQKKQKTGDIELEKEKQTEHTDSSEE